MVASSSPTVQTRSFKSILNNYPFFLTPQSMNHKVFLTLIFKYLLNLFSTQCPVWQGDSFLLNASVGLFQTPFSWSLLLQPIFLTSWCNILWIGKSYQNIPHFKSSSSCPIAFARLVLDILTKSSPTIRGSNSIGLEQVLGIYVSCTPEFRHGPVFGNHQER